MADPSSSNARFRPSSHPSAYSPRRTLNTGDGKKPRPESAPQPPSGAVDLSMINTLATRRPRPRPTRVIAALDTIPEASHAYRDSDSTLSGQHAGLGIGEKRETRDFALGPTMPPTMYNGEGKLECEAVAYEPDPHYPQRYSQAPPNIHQNMDQYNLPYFRNEGTRPPKKSLTARAADFFKHIAEDQDLPSLPPSRMPSEREGLVPQPEKKTQPTGRGGRPAFGHAIQSRPANPADNDMFLEAMRVNGDLEVRDSLAVDADVQLYPQPEPDKLTQIPYFLQNRLRHRGQGEGDLPQQKPDEKAMPGAGRTPFSYRERRKKPKHRIVHNCDCTSSLSQVFIVH